MWELIGALASGIGGYFAGQEQKGAAEAAAAARLQANQQAQSTLGQNYNSALNFQQGQLNQGNTLAAQQQQQNMGAFAPYTAAAPGALAGMGQYGAGGLQAFQTQQALSGALGPEAQQQAMSGVQDSPMFAGLAQQGENAILQNASATGGLRGGNTQGALAQFRPQLLNQLLQQQFSNLGGLSALGSQNYGNLAQLGQSSAQGQSGIGANILGQQLGLAGQISGNVAQLSGDNMKAMTDLIGQQGATAGGNAMAQGQANAGIWNQLGGTLNMASLLKGGYFGTKPTTSGIMGTAQMPSPNYMAAYGGRVG